MMNVPVLVIIGMSPMKRSWNFRSPWAGPGALLTSSTLTFRAAE